jgi:hypothetical protein
LQKLLLTKVKAPEGKPTALREALEMLRQKYNIRYVIAEREFKEANNEKVLDKEVKTPASEDRTLKEYLQRILDQVGATYRVASKTILIYPGKPKKE